MQECLDGGESLPAIMGTSYAADLHDAIMRESINFAMLDIVDTTEHPEVAYERIREILTDVGYELPPASSLSEIFGQESGEEVFALGMNTPNAPMIYLYFAYSIDESGGVEILAELLTEDELEELISNED
jgi:hypothetical protein